MFSLPACLWLAGASPDTERPEAGAVSQLAVIAPAGLPVHQPAAALQLADSSLALGPVRLPVFLQLA